MQVISLTTIFDLLFKLFTEEVTELLTALFLYFFVCFSLLLTASKLFKWRKKYHGKDEVEDNPSELYAYSLFITCSWTFHNLWSLLVYIASFLFHGHLKILARLSKTLTSYVASLSEFDLKSQNDEFFCP